MKETIQKGLTRLLVCAAVLGVVASFASANPRPLMMSGFTMLTQDPQSPFLRDMDGAGTGTHLGNWTNTGTFFLDPKSGRGVGVIDLVAANGDHLFFTVVGSSDPYGQVAATY